jgi:formylglycine-generating enzyme required for sulfatase activity
LRPLLSLINSRCSGALNYARLLSQLLRFRYIDSRESVRAQWAQEFYDSRVPGILRNKWIEKRHIQHGIYRWSRDKSRDLHVAWMNGSGIMLWENIFGQWVGWSPRDSYIMKTMSHLQQRFASLFSTGQWTPLVDTKPFPNVYASLWEDENTKLWTLVNRSWVTIEGELLHIDIDPDYLYYDLVAGRNIIPDEMSKTLSGKIIPRGTGCFYACKKTAIPADLDDFMQEMASIAREATSDVSSPVPEMKLRKLIPTRKYAVPPAGMIEIDPVKGEMDVVFTCKETGFYQSIEEEYINRGMPTWHQPVTMTKQVNTGRFAIDETPVTNLQFKAFLDATNYQPRMKDCFLKHWINGQIPSGKEDHPVVYVCLDDARAYAQWAGKRLPSEEEWQIAGGGKGQLTYPWGVQLEKGKYNEATDGATTPVKAFPQGRSPYGVWDMCGNTWELTESEYSNGRIHFCILKGGSCYRAEGSIWYFDGGIKPVNFAAKQLLMYPGIDRCATVGFRCVADM